MTASRKAIIRKVTKVGKLTKEPLLRIEDGINSTYYRVEDALSVLNDNKEVPQVTRAQSGFLQHLEARRRFEEADAKQANFNGVGDDSE